MSIYQTVYVSSATSPFDSLQLQELLEQSRLKNAELNITGVLLFKGGNFLQVLEGEQEKVEELMQTIRNDVRHRGIITMVRQQVAQRDFESWAMAFPNIYDHCFLNVKGYRELISLDFGDMEQSRVLRLVKVFAQNMR